MVSISDQLLDVACTLVPYGLASLHLLGRFTPAPAPPVPAGPLATYLHHRRAVWQQARQNWPLARPTLGRQLAAGPLRWLVGVQLTFCLLYPGLLHYLGREMVVFDYLRLPVAALLYDAALIVSVLAAGRREEGGDEGGGFPRPPFTPLPRRAKALPAPLPRLRPRQRVRQRT